MKVGIVTTALRTTDGWGRYSLEIVSALRKHVDIKVIASVSQEKLEGIEIYGLLPEPLDLHLPKIIIETFKIKPYLMDCDIIHCLVEPYAPIIALANITIKKPVILTGVGTYSIEPLNHLIQGKLLKYAFKKADKIICISKFTEQEILKRVRLDNTTIIYPGVSSRFFQQRQAEKEKKNGNRILLSVGAIKSRKGYDVSIKAFAEVKKIFPDVKYYIAGPASGTYYDFLRNLTKELGVSEEVRFLGKVSDEELVKLYHLADIFVLTSKNVGNMFEGFGLVYLEANACGKPAIGTLGCGAEDAIIDGYNGFLVPQNDSKSTAEAIVNLLGNPQTLRQMGENARQRAKEMSWENAAKQILKTYQEIKGGNKR